MKNLNELFAVRYGNSFALSQMTTADKRTGVAFVSRKAKDNGVAAYVAEVPHIPPNPAGDMTCALNGEGGVLSTFVQDRPFYTAYHVACLTPISEMTVHQKLYYCACIWANRYRYSWGRQANRSLKDILLPSIEDVPLWVSEERVVPEFKNKLDMISLMSQECPELRMASASTTCVQDLFTVTYGHSLELNRLTQCSDGLNFVSRTSEHNGVSARIVPPDGLAAAKAGIITVAAGGSVMEAFLQTEPFYSGRDIYWLDAEDMSIEEKLFYCCCIRANRFRYSYGRQANRTLATLPIPPKSAIPQWVYGSMSRLSATWKPTLDLV